MLFNAKLTMVVIKVKKEERAYGVRREERDDQEIKDGERGG